MQFWISGRGTNQGILGHILGTSGFAEFFLDAKHLYKSSYPIFLKKIFVNTTKMGQCNVVSHHKNGEVIYERSLSIRIVNTPDSVR